MAYLPLDLSSFSTNFTNCTLVIYDGNGKQDYLFNLDTTTITELGSGRVQIHDEEGSHVSFYPSQMVDLGLTVADLTTRVAECQGGVVGSFETLSHFIYNPVTDKLEADRAIETTLNSLFLGEQHKMSSGSENIFFTNLTSDINFFPMWGGLKDQALTVNQGASGFIPPSGRVYSDMFSLPLGGQPNPSVGVGYEGDNYFGVNITGLGITTVAAEEVDETIRLEYRIEIAGRNVYKQVLPRNAARSTANDHIYDGDVIEWFFDHPVDVRAGTTLFAEIHKVRISDDVDLGVFLVKQGDTVDPNTGLLRYQATVHNRLFEDKDLELISPYLKYKAMDFGLDATGSTILLRDLSLGSDNVLVPHAVNTLEATANGTEIQIKIKDGAKIIVESLPVNAISINGSFVNSVLNLAVVQLNEIFTNTSGFISPDTFVNSFTLSGNNLTLGLNDGVSYTVDVTSLGVDENNFVASGSLSGSDLTLTMADATTVVIDASSLAVDSNDVVESGTINGDDLELTLSNSSVITIDVSSLAVDTTLYVESGVLSGTDLVLTMSDTSTVTIDASSLAIDENTTITGGEVSGTDILLDVSDGSTLTIDASTLGGAGSSGNPVVSGSVVGTDLVLVLDDATQITIDASNMINGSTTFASGADWYISYGTYANENVNSTTSHLDSSRTPPIVGGKAPFYFGTALERGTEFRWNNNPNASHLLGIWDGTEAEAGTYNSRVPSNWSTAFNYHVTGFQASSNVSLTNTTATNRYTPNFGAPLALRFLSDGHITLSDLSGATEVEIAKTNNALVDTSFQLQLGCDANFVFPQFVTQETSSIWSIVHDFDNTEDGIINGIKDHTVIKSGISIVPGEKIMFMLDEAGQGDFFGTGYTDASTGVSNAEEQLVNRFVYQTNEALVFTFGGASAWTNNTSANGYFFAANLHQYRNGGGSGTVQGMHSLRYYSDNSLQIWDEDTGEHIATATAAADGNAIHFYHGVKGARTYSSIPVISKQTIGQGTQPNVNFVPTVANQTATLQGGTFLNFQILTSDNIVNQFVELDAPSWMSLDQNSGVLSGTAAAFTNSAADTIVVNCKAGNAIGGSVDFTVTVTITATLAANTTSLQYPSNNSSSVLTGNPANVTALQRAANGSGSSDAWSISMWVKPVSDSNEQTLFYYGGDNLTTEGRIELTQFSGTDLKLRFGHATQYLFMFSLGTMTVGQWNHIMITYDGGTTGSTAADISDYFSRFSFSVNGANGINTVTNLSSGYSGSIVADRFKIGNLGNINYFKGSMHQIAIWDTDESSNLATIYNSGATQDLSTLASAPAHIYELGSSISTISDSVGSADLTAFGFTAASIVTDAP